MKRLSWLVLLLGFTIGGCALLDTAFGTKEKPGPLQRAAEGGSNIPGLVGLVSSLVLGVGNVYQGVRAKQDKTKKVKAHNLLNALSSVDKQDIVAIKALIEQIKKEISVGSKVS